MKLAGARELLAPAFLTIIKFIISHIFNKCKEYQTENPHFGYFFYPSGNKQETNYGGELFNDALNYVLQFYNKKNTWVYILDDDNTISPLMGEILNKAIDIADREQKRCIYFNMIYENGVHINPYKAIKVGKNVLIFSKATT